MTQVLGIDGCRAGWFAIIKQDDRWSYALAPTIDTLLNDYGAADRIFIDIPVGLAEDQTRQCDQLARRLLSPHRHSSVFSTPVRNAVYAPDYTTACRINAQQTDRKITRQTWNICPKIREVDTWLRQHPNAQSRIYESHPEVAFYALNKAHPLKTRKKSPEGREQRLTLLAQVIGNARQLYDRAVGHYPRAQLQTDDILDAMVLAVMASCKETDHCYLPQPAPVDRHGIMMRIVYAEQ
ncbi:DUF429 domain-containing protein [Thiohalophilus sp.]|uniref:DUF429 domain-containing protein n=1 Tax=Thiohalophilus sp. TaxID=3028392 RepID=UPI002ACEB4F0|nr:DUF429 domain-containing protein [Thiohalophilus sp.]MDZ7803867.1 DUF429 domain-containing protein [Thiohalophilus sp.]